MTHIDIKFKAHCDKHSDHDIQLTRIVAKLDDIFHSYCIHHLHFTIKITQKYSAVMYYQLTRIVARNIKIHQDKHHDHEIRLTRIVARDRGLPR